MERVIIKIKNECLRGNARYVWGIQMCPVNLKLNGILITSRDFIMESGKHIKKISRDFDRTAKQKFLIMAALNKQQENLLF